MFWLYAALIFLFSVVSEAWTIKYIQASSDKLVGKTVLYTLLLGLYSAGSTLLYIKVDIWFLVPELVGSILGAYLAVRNQ